MSNQPLPPAVRREIKKLQQRKFREVSGLVVIEGESQVQELLKSDWPIHSIIVSAVNSLRFQVGKVPVYLATVEQMQWLSELQTSPQIMAVASVKSATFQDFDLHQPIIYLDAVSDPGNLGTILRTAEWFGVTQILLGPGTVDPLNSKVIRAAMGSLLRLKWARTGNSLLELRKLQERQYHLVATTPTAGSTMLPQGPVCFLFGSEAHGLRPEIRALATEQYTIPRIGGTESLNVAIAFGITLFDWRQQMA